MGANSVDPDQTAPVSNILICVHTVCQKATETIQQRRKQTTFVVIGTLRGPNDPIVFAHTGKLFTMNT